VPFDDPWMNEKEAFEVSGKEHWTAEETQQNELASADRRRRRAAQITLGEFYFTYLAYAEYKNHKNTLKRVVKLCEESGEVAEAVLACLGSENKASKIAESGQTPHERLEEEIGDVIITALHIAHTEKLDKLRLFKRATEKMREKINSTSNLSK